MPHQTGDNTVALLPGETVFVSKEQTIVGPQELKLTPHPVIGIMHVEGIEVTGRDSVEPKTWDVDLQEPAVETFMALVRGERTQG